MNDSLLTSELQIPDFESVEDRINCRQCHVSYCRRRYNKIKSRYDCKKFTIIISIVKLILEILFFSTITVFSLIYFNGFWLTICRIFFAFIFLLTSDLLTDKLIKWLCVTSEERRKREYDIKVQKLKEENEAIKRAKAGITEEIQEFLDYSKSLLNELRKTFETIQDKLNLDQKEEKRVFDKFQETLRELEILNTKLSENNFESSYITTLYEIHLPKLLEYSKQFLTYLNSNALTLKQIVEFSKLLEVFRVKISNHTEYLQNKIEDDFIIKMKALNEDVIPDFDGNEVKKDE